jgi:hypothetical protein
LFAGIEGEKGPPGEVGPMQDMMLGSINLISSIAVALSMSCCVTNQHCWQQQSLSNLPANFGLVHYFLADQL